MKRLLVLNFFPAFTPPASGGELRYFHLYDELSRHYDVTLLSPTYHDRPFEVVEHKPTFREYRVPKEEVHLRLHREIGAQNIGPEISALVCSLSARQPNKYHDTYLELHKNADIIIHDCPFMCDYDLFLGIDGKPRVYNSYNYEARLFSQLFSGPHAQQYIDHIAALERTLCEKADLVLTISDEERQAYLDDFRLPATKVRVAPNGIRPEELAALREPSRKNTRPKAFFIGSAHPPNLEAAAFIVHTLAPACPDFDFVVAGKCSMALAPGKAGNVAVHGLVSEEERRALFAAADVAIVPLSSGGGSSLKTLEFLSCGLPLISTEVGVRGLGLAAGVHFAHAEKADFAARLNHLRRRPDDLARLAAAGRALVNERYSWRAIATSVHGELEQLSQHKATPLVVINDFEVSEPSGGGQIRINRLYSNLSTHLPVLLLCLNDRGELRRRFVSDQFVELSVPKTAAHLVEQRRLDGKFMASVSDIVSASQCADNALLIKVIGSAQLIARALVYCHPYMIRAQAGTPPCPVVHESLNHEGALKRRILLGHPDYDWATAEVEAVEHQACRTSDLIVSVSGEEHAALRAAAAPKQPEVVTIANGVSLAPEAVVSPDFSISDLLGNRPLVLFIGSGHSPNITAAMFIVERLAPAMPEAVFGIVGSVCGAPSLRGQLPDNVLLFGCVGDAEKAALLHLATVGVNPTEEGAGSNLKLAEYFAARLPTVTTAFGARGYTIRHEHEALIASLAEFPSAIRRVCDDATLRESLIGHSYAYARAALDWRKLAKRYGRVLAPLLRQETKPRVLVVTYRLTDPPLGGAEQYLLNILKALDRRGDFAVDVVTFDIREIRNRYHFSTDVSRNDEPVRASAFAHTTIRYFAADETDPALRLAAARLVYERWNTELRAIAVRHFDLYTAPMLMGGWYSAENHDGRDWAWSSDEAQVFVGDAVRLTIEGIAPQPTTLSVEADGKPTDEHRVSGAFTLAVDLPACRVLGLRTGKYWAGEDPRPLGIKVSALRLAHPHGEIELSLRRDFRAFLREHALDAWVDSLIDNAARREPRFDDAFLELRGPSSATLDGWLRHHAGNYDAIVGHSLPFRTAVIAATQARLAGVPYVIIPHTHYEDEFYHWQSFYEALRDADAVISSAKSTIAGFYTKIGAHAVELHGGLEATEYRDVNPAVFRARHSAKAPFFLVLGRKDAPKNYRWAIDAVAEVRARGHECELVVIGRDEDRIPIKAAHVTYLGEQPREVVLGALHDCLGLVHMSESESFGLVVLEAWMLGKPVVVNEQCGALADLVSDGVDGRFASRETLADRLVELLAHPNLAARLGATGRARAASYTWDAAAAELGLLITAAIQAPQTRSALLATSPLAPSVVDNGR